MLLLPFEYNSTPTQNVKPLTFSQTQLSYPKYIIFSGKWCEILIGNNKFEQEHWKKCINENTW